MGYNFGTITIKSAKVNKMRTKLTVAVNMQVNSTGWSVDKAFERDANGNITKVTLTARKPTGIVGWGFPSGGLNLDVDVDGPFAKKVEVVATVGSTTA